MTAPSTRIIAHRGAKHARPENTQAAFDQALAEGADGIELDLQLTRDGVPVVFHDHTLRKLGQPRQRLSALSLAELRALDFGAWYDSSFAGQRIPTLEEVLFRYGHRTELSLELKATRDVVRNTSLMNLALDRVRASGLEDKVLILCFNAGLLQQAHAREPGLRYVLNGLGPEATLAQARQMPWLHAVDVDIRWLTPEAGRQLRKCGQVLMSYTCNTQAHWQAARAAGVEAVITNRPAWFRQLIQTG